MDEHFRKLALQTLDYARDVLHYNETQMHLLKFLETWENENGILFWYEKIVIKHEIIAQGYHERLQDNICAYSDDHRLVFCDLGGFLSGNLMKFLGNSDASSIEQLKTKLPTAKIGDIFIIRKNVFVVVRKHYANKVTAATIAPMISNITKATEGLKLRCYAGDFPQFTEELKKIPGIIWNSKCESLF